MSYLCVEAGGQLYERYQQRSAHYWKVAYNTVNSLLENTLKRQNNSLFSC